MSTEDALLERFFVEPGLSGPIRSVQITDDDIVEIFGSPDVEGARVAFVQSLPHPTLLSAILSAEIPPPFRDGHPDFVRVLLFLCWMQVTRLRPLGLRNFRDMLERHLQYRVQAMQGLNVLWETLARYLMDLYHIELVLPDRHPHRQIGRTPRIAFPTWRDRGAMRRLRNTITPAARLDPLTVSNHISSAAAFANAPVSFRYNYEIWDAARRRKDAEAADLAFWRAWLAIVSEAGGTDEIEAVEDEYGAVTLSAVSPDGTTRPMVTVRNDKRLAQPLIDHILKGFVFMEAKGFGRYRSTESTDSATLLIGPSAMTGINDQNARQIRPLADGWNLVTFRKAPDLTAKQRPSFPTSVGWVEGIRVGSGYLGRVPLAPAFKYNTGSAEPDVLFEGAVIPTVSLNGRLELQSGNFDGTLSAAGTRSFNVRVLSSALEHPELRRKGLDAASEVHEDGPLFGTWPLGAGDDFSAWSGVRHNTAVEFTAIAEAIYARSSRGISLAEGVEIVGRGIARRDDAPNVWDVVRSLVDAGWIDLASLRDYPARRILQRPLEFVRYSKGSRGGAVVGPLPIRIRERLQACADASGATVSFLLGVSEWSPQFCRIEAADDETLEEFLRRADLPVAPAPTIAPPFSQCGEKISLHHYQPDARWHHETGTFRFSSASSPEPALLRMISSRESDPKLYVIQSEAVVLVFRSASLAIAAFANLADISAGRREAGLLRRSAAKIPLPSSWARWIALRTGCNAGPIPQGAVWGYAYACDDVVEQVLRDPMSLPRENSIPAQWDSFLTSRSRMDRHVALQGRGLARPNRVKLLGGVTR